MRCLRWAVAVCLILGLAGGCCERCKICQDEKQKPKCKQEPEFNPTEQYPEWAFDAPFYYRPASDRGDIGQAIEPRRPGGPTHYYTREKMVFLPRPTFSPTNKQPLPTMPPRTIEADLGPRIAVYWTDNGGKDWLRAGYFGLGQTHFAFPVDCDGVYGFRFVGPTLPPAKCTPPRPEVIYHVDTVPAHVMVYIEPNQPHYAVNDSITVHWMAQDMDLADSPVSLSACWTDEDCETPEWTPIIHEQEAEGSMVFVIPPQGAGRTFKIRADARDRAGNLGVGFSAPMQVVSGPASAQPTTADPVGPVSTTQPDWMIGHIMTMLGDAELSNFSEVSESPEGPEYQPDVWRMPTIGCLPILIPYTGPDAP